jgi:SseB protein N-terminal domain
VSSGEDVGLADPRLVAALTAADAAAVRTALLTARLLVPVLATGDESTAAELAVPGLIGADGRRALPVFSGVAALQAWRADARPVPMPGSQAVVAAHDEGYDALVLDIAGPVVHVIDTADLAVLATAARRLLAGDASGIQILGE